MRPTKQQLAWQDAAFGIFCHFGINTFYGKEWSDGTLDPAGFAPADLDARQWAQTAAEAGARYLILTAKHHDGFCLWPTATTDYSVRSSPYGNDVVAEAAQACREAGIGFGVYLSPWDRNASCYADPAAYDDFYCRQLEELCTNYGELFEIWFDGAGSEGRTYDWDAIMGVIDAHQPRAMVFNMGRPTIRWIGNEDGLAADPCEYVIDDAYLPPECDVPIRRHWFWQPDDLHTLKSAEHLLAIWYRSVGLGAGLLLNVPPDRTGRFDENDRARLLELSGLVRARFGHPQIPDLGRGGVARFPTRTRFDHLILHEDLGHGQQIRCFEVVVDDVVIARGETVGVRRIVPVPEQRTETVTIRLQEGRLRGIEAHLTEQPVPQLEEQPEFMTEKVDQ